MAVVSSKTLLERTYKLQTGTSAGPDSALLIVLHPGASTGEKFRTTATQLASSLDGIIDAKKCYAVYPDGFFRIAGFGTWHSGWLNAYARELDADDVGFIKNLRSKCIAELSVDPTKVYLLGYSNGACLAYNYMCTYPTDIAGAVIVAGALLMDADEIAASVNVSVVHVYGTLDVEIPPGGGFSNTGGFYVPSFTSTKNLLESHGAHISAYTLTNQGHTFTSVQAGLSSLYTTSVAGLVNNMLP